MVHSRVNQGPHDLVPVAGGGAQRTVVGYVRVSGHEVLRDIKQPSLVDEHNGRHQAAWLLEPVPKRSTKA
ncbi:hypothetical protein BX281_1319 [Streptomyces sp. Ag82_O1-15]|nr:hypothetical protein BX281_1319 [Streptomyces sp. Ag82_O1-15]